MPSFLAVRKTRQAISPLRKDRGDWNGWTERLDGAVGRSGWTERLDVDVDVDMDVDVERLVK